MVSPAALGRNATQAFRHQLRAIQAPRRGLAAAASGSFQYETGDAAGVKFASRDLPGPTTTLTVVAKAGTRYQILPGYSDALEKFAFKVRLHESMYTSSFEIIQLIARESVNFQTLCLANHTGIGTAWRRARCISHTRKPCLTVQVLTRRSTILHRAAGRGYLKDKIYRLAKATMVKPLIN